MGKIVNIGAVGVGAFMARQHLPNISDMAGIRIHTLCDLDETLLARRVEEYRPERWTTDAEEVFRDPEVDAVLVGTQGRQHAEFVMMAARYGKHVYVEKPMTMSMEETSRVLKAVSVSGINVGVGFNRRFAPSMVEAKRIFHDYKHGPCNLLYRIVDDHRVRPSYIFDMNEGGGHLLTEGCHIFDLMAWFLEQEPVEIYAAGPLETDNVVVIRFADDSLATMLCGGKGGVVYPKELMEVFCEARTLVVDHFYELRFDGPGENFIRTFPVVAGGGDVGGAPGMSGFYRASFAARPKEDITGPHAANGLRTPSVDKGHRQAIRAFAQALVEGEKYGAGVVDGARATVCALKGYESIRSGRPVRIRPSSYGLESSR